MNLLIDYVEQSSATIKNLSEKMQELNNQYMRFPEKQLRVEMARLQETIKKQKFQAGEKIAENMQEVYLIKKHFPAFFAVLLEDEGIGLVLERAEWLSSFKKVGKEGAKELEKLKQTRKEIRACISFLKTWTGRIDARSLRATWPSLSDFIKKDMEKEEAVQKLLEADKKLRREGWRIMLNEPYIIKPLHKFLEELKQTSKIAAERQKEAEKSRGKGSVAEYTATKELRRALRKRLLAARKCKHLLLANPGFLMKLKKQKMTWRDSEKNKYLNDFVKKLDYTPLDEKKWVYEMRKRLEI